MVKVAWLWGGLAGVALTLGAVQLYLRHVWFYRDPPRTPPADPSLIVAPCDGKVIYIRPVEDGLVHAEKLGQRIPLDEITKDRGAGGAEGWIVGIFMTPLDVHYNYAPISGQVTRVVHTPARVNLPMVDLWEYVRLTYLRQAVDLFGRKYHLNNERNTIFLEGADVSVAMVEIADRFVNKISCYVQPGDRVRTGQKVSFIARGSQVDLVVFRKDVEWLVGVGQQVYGGQTPLARLQGGGVR